MTPQEQSEAFFALLTSCLQISDQDELLVIYDETFQDFMPVFLQLVKDLRLFVTFLYISQDYQIALTEWTAGDESNVSLPQGVAGCIQYSSAVLAMINGELETSRVRRALLQQTRPEGCRWAHIPGISSEVLRAIRSSPFEEIMADCELLAWALGEANTAELTTFDCQGGSYRLVMELGGWGNEPLMSPGVLGRGSWGNVPPGETFCCPFEVSVSGEVCINGSVPSRVLMPQEEVILRFDKGKAREWRSASGIPDNPGIGFMESEKKKAALNRDRNWNTFAELGIGLNPAITRLTGNSLFDEKALGTIHVAIGDNSFFGHNTRASIHADLVTYRPTLKLDSYVVIEDGKLQYSMIQEWREQVFSSLFSVSYDKRIELRQAKVSEQDGRLLRQLRKAGRVGYVRILNDEGSRALALLANILINMGGVFPEDLIRDHEHLLGFPTTNLLGILLHYGALEVLE